MKFCGGFNKLLMHLERNLQQLTFTSLLVCFAYQHSHRTMPKNPVKMQVSYLPKLNSHGQIYYSCGININHKFLNMLSGYRQGHKQLSHLSRSHTCTLFVCGHFLQKIRMWFIKCRNNTQFKYEVNIIYDFFYWHLFFFRFLYLSLQFYFVS